MTETHPLEAEIEAGDELVATIGGEHQQLVIDEIKPRYDDGGGFIMIHALDASGRWWDLQSEVTPRGEWGEMEGARRYQVGTETHWTDEEQVESMKRTTLGVEPSSLVPGEDFEYVDGETYRVILTPSEREYDGKVLAYCLSDRGKTGTVKRDPGNIVVEATSLPI